MDNQQYAIPAESLTVAPIDPNGRYLVIIQVSDDVEFMDSRESEEQILAAFRKLGVTAAQVAFVYVQGTAVIYTHEVKPPEPERRNHRG